MALSPSVESFSSAAAAGSSMSRVGGAKKVRKAGGVVWDGLEADGKRLKLVRCGMSPIPRRHLSRGSFAARCMLARTAAFTMTALHGKPRCLPACGFDHQPR